MSDRMKTWWKRLTCRHDWQKKAEFHNDDDATRCVVRYICPKCGDVRYRTKSYAKTVRKGA